MNELSFVDGQCHVDLWFIARCTNHEYNNHKKQCFSQVVFMCFQFYRKVCVTFFTRIVASHVSLTHKASSFVVVMGRMCKSLMLTKICKHASCYISNDTIHLHRSVKLTAKVAQVVRINDMRLLFQPFKLTWEISSRNYFRNLARLGTFVLDVLADVVLY